MLEQQQAAHDSAVRTGAKTIQDDFARFNLDYYSKYAQTYKDAYNPQLDDQYSIAKDQLMATLAGNGQLGGSVGNNAQAQLEKTYANTQSDIANKATDAANTLKGNIANQETNLYNLNANAADPLETAAQAQATTAAIVAPQSYPTLSNIFGDVLSPLATANKTNARP